MPAGDLLLRELAELTGEAGDEVIAAVTDEQNAAARMLNSCRCISPQRPLPECLTRFLSEPTRQSWPRPGRSTPSPRTGEARPAVPNRAMPIFLAWALAYDVLGFAVILLLWKSMN